MYWPPQWYYWKPRRSFDAIITHFLVPSVVAVRVADQLIFVRKTIFYLCIVEQFVPQGWHDGKARTIGWRRYYDGGRGAVGDREDHDREPDQDAGDEG